MKNYHDHLRLILEKGTWKKASRKNLPKTLSYFGGQFRYDLGKGFPLLTTKKINFKHIVTELLWFLKGDSNIKYLVDNGCNIWNEDAYQFYLKLHLKYIPKSVKSSFESFINMIKENKTVGIDGIPNYTLGDTGEQYPRLWRNWGNEYKLGTGEVETDQILDLIKSLKNNPFSRRHILTAWNPATLNDMALPACHSFVQFNCRELSHEERCNLATPVEKHKIQFKSESRLDSKNIPKYYLDCQLYQRSADMFLG